MVFGKTRKMKIDFFLKREIRYSGKNAVFTEKNILDFRRDGEKRGKIGSCRLEFVPNSNRF